VTLQVAARGKVLRRGISDTAAAAPMTEQPVEFDFSIFRDLMYSLWQCA
jgi:hypothetical protein